jgi:hypothetical protein
VTDPTSINVISSPNTVAGPCITSYTTLNPLLETASSLIGAVVNSLAGM